MARGSRSITPSIRSSSRPNRRRAPPSVARWAAFWWRSTASRYSPPERPRMHIDELDTPVPVVDLDIVEHNLAKMQAYCDSHGLALRPHIKTHKIPSFAHRQVELGAKGITCQKLGEAEVMIDAGLDDILISYPLIGPAKALRLAALARRARMSVAVDNTLALETVGLAARTAGNEIGVLVEFD